jgi:hypothetical protein
MVNTLSKVLGLDEIKFHDNLRLPTIYEQRIDSYKEWHHFNIFDRKNNLFVMLNFGLTGNIFRHDRGILSTVCIVEKDKNKIYSTLETQDTQGAMISHLRPDIIFGKNIVTFDNREYHVSADIKSLGILFDLKFEPISEPIISESRPFGSGSIGWFAIPRLTVTGSMKMGGKEYTIHDSSGYHDHDWGYYNWGEQVGWEWGVFTESHPRGTTIIFDQRTSGIGGKVDERILYLYQDKRLRKMVTGHRLKTKLIGTYSHEKIVIPGIMRVLYPYQSCTAPAKIVTTARLSRLEKITLDFRTKRLVQIIVPNHDGKGAAQLNQLIGEVHVHSTLNDIQMKNEFIGYMESVGPI